MDDVLKRLSAVESSVSEVRVQVSGIAASVQYLATKADLSSMETRIIKWMIATALTSVGLAAGLAFSLAKFVH